MRAGRKDLISILDAPAAEETQNEALDWVRRGSSALFGLSNEQLKDLAASFGVPTYRGRQLAEGLYRGWNSELSGFSNLPRLFAEKLAAEGYRVGLPEIVQTFTSVDGTERYLVRGNDEQTVETVWMPDGDDGEAGDGSAAGDEELRVLSAARADAQHTDSARTPLRATICVSSQVGCAVNCQFCLTAKMGIQRNLTAGEIAGQVVAVLKRQQVVIGRDRINIVFMGMGEPFLNYDEFMAAVRLVVSEVGIAASRMTVSTSGIVPGILRFTAEPVRPKLAISLNASNNEVRQSIMPVTRKWDIAAVLDAVRQVPLRAKERVTFEYVLLGGVNDRLQHADETAVLLRRANLPVKVNLIVWNPGPGIAFHKPNPSDVAAFQQRLIARGIPAFIRRPRGLDIYAACGQLKRTVS